MNSKKEKELFKFLFFIAKQSLCNHEYKFNRNIYGDEINYRNGSRSEYICSKCKSYKYDRNYLVTSEDMQ